MEIDRKFRFIGYNPSKHGTIYTEEDGVLFLAKDRAFLETLPTYREKLVELGADARQVAGVDLLIERVRRYQEENPRLVKVPDVDDGPEAAAVLRPNVR